MPDKGRGRVSPPHPAHSERILQGELNQPRIHAGPGDYAKRGGRRSGRARVVELRVIEHVEELGPELQRLAFRKPGHLNQ